MAWKREAGGSERKGKVTVEAEVKVRDLKMLQCLL
jgi:hypothetical protein